jgi:hypothetical protein
MDAGKVHTSFLGQYILYLGIQGFFPDFLLDITVYYVGTCRVM